MRKRKHKELHKKTWFDRVIDRENSLERLRAVTTKRNRIRQPAVALYPDGIHPFMGQYVTGNFGTYGTVASQLNQNYFTLGTTSSIQTEYIPQQFQFSNTYYTPTWTVTNNTNGVYVNGINGFTYDTQPFSKQAARAALIAKARKRSSLLRTKIAERVADEQLLRWLTEEQQKTWEEEKYFTVITADGKRKYRIRKGLSYNVVLVETDDKTLVGASGKPIREGSRLCCHVYHPEGWLPDADNVLAQKLMLETREHEFLALANVG